MYTVWYDDAVGLTLPRSLVRSWAWGSVCSHKADKLHSEKKTKLNLPILQKMFALLILFEFELHSASTWLKFFRTIEQNSARHSGAASSLTAQWTPVRSYAWWPLGASGNTVHPGWDALLCMFHLCLCGFLPASLVSSHISKTCM